MRMRWYVGAKATKLTLRRSAKLMDLEGLGFPVLVMSASAAGLLPFPGGDRSFGPPSPLGFEPPTAAPPGFKGGKLEKAGTKLGIQAQGEREDLPVAAAAAAMVRGGTRCYRASGVQEDGRELRGGELATRARKKSAFRRGASRRVGDGDGGGGGGALWDLNSAEKADCLRGKMVGPGCQAAASAVTVEPNEALCRRAMDQNSPPAMLLLRIRRLLLLLSAMADS
ncbi:hypothetical protein HU200_015850 [Digitaria exilis]|uniref:Uncharacterized protein n=1 Tax=Digitaria exilis TaxID=1010633 RepID=A0A835F8R5_9POAL|nr:hypothetical protein HU200_015850 [Digitaria exilis]